MEALLRVDVSDLLIEKRKDYPQDDDLTYARRTRALIVSHRGEDTYTEWIETRWGQAFQRMWGGIIDKCGELGL